MFSSCCKLFFLIFLQIILVLQCRNNDDPCLDDKTDLFCVKKYIKGKGMSLTDNAHLDLLSISVLSRNRNAIKRLIKEGENLNIANRDGYIPLILAVGQV